MMATDGTTLLVLAELAARATLVLALAWLGARVALRRSASTRYAVWAAGFIAAFALPIAAGVLPAWRLAVLPAAPPVTLTHLGQPLENFRPTTLQSAPTPKLTDGLPASPSVERSSRLGQLADAVTPMTWGLLAWAAIATGLVLRYLISLFAVRWMTRRADRLDDARWRDALDVATATLGLTRTPQLVVSTRVSVPFTCGLFRPVLVVPMGALAWTDERIHVVLLHELAHVARRDCLLQAVSQVVCALYWFNPLAWLGARRLRAERERACDDLVLACGTPGADYAQHLLDIARAATLDARPALASAALAMARPSELEGRLLAILDPRRSRARAAHHLLWQVAVLATVVALPVATVRLVARPAVVSPEITVADRGTATTPSPRDGVDASAPDHPTTMVPAVKAKPLGDVRAARAAGDSHRDGAQTGSPVLSPGKAAESKSTKDNSNDNNDDEGEPRSVSPGVLQALMDALKDSDAEVRKSAMQALSRFRSPAAFDAFVVGLKDQDPEIRQQAAFALSQLRDDRATDALIGALKDENAEVRQQAAFALSQLRVARAVPSLVAALKDVDDEVREQALFALSQIRDASAVPALIGTLSDAKPNVREQAAFALSQIGGRAAVPGLIGALKDKEPSVREQAAFALSQIGDASAIEALTAAIKDPVADVRQQAIFALSQLADGDHNHKNPRPVIAPSPMPAPTPK